MSRAVSCQHPNIHSRPSSTQITFKMRGLYLLAALPAVWACTNPDSDPCASYMSANGATASAFCATFTKSSVTATTGLPSWASNCSNKPSAISKECSCYFTGTAASTTATSTSKATTSTATSTKTSSGSTTTATNSCGSAAINGLVGYASGTTGGGSGSGTTVTSCSALKSAVNSGGVIKISGVLDSCGIIDLGSDTTVLGVGSKSGKYSLPLLIVSTDLQDSSTVNVLQVLGSSNVFLGS